MPEYQFKFCRRGEPTSTLLYELATDTEACARARAQLRNSREFDLVEVRRGFVFIHRIGRPRLVE